MPDLFFYRAPEEIEKQELKEREAAEEVGGETQDYVPDAPVIPLDGDWPEEPAAVATAGDAKVADWEAPAEKTEAAGDWGEQDATWE